MAAGAQMVAARIQVRELILLRHAHADPAAAGVSDVDRALSATGLAEAAAAGNWLREHALIPDRVLCSPARRARETLEVVLEQVGYVDQRLDAGIYEASAGQLITLIDAHLDADRLLLVGHNPGLERLAALLHSGQSSDYRGMPPAGIAVLNLTHGELLEPGSARLGAFWWP